MESVLRPRDIQARIRSGESPEAVAAAAQTSVDKIMGFAGPVLAERAYVAQQAQKASVRRRAGSGPVGNLGTAVATRLEADSLDPEAVEWDAWRRDDGRWTLVAAYARGADQRRAQFVYDQAGRYVVADDDESRRLVGELAGTSPAPEEDVEEQTSLGDDAIEVVTGRRPTPLSLAPEPAPEPQPSDWISTQASDRPARRPVVEPDPEPATLFEVETSTEDAPAEPAVPGPVDEEPTEPVTQEAREAATGTERPRPRRSSKGRARASVPSWDEIMLGSQRGE